MKTTISEAISLLLSHDRICFAAHRNPDGDSLGGCLALSSVLRSLGKEVFVVCETPVPESLIFLQDSGNVLRDFPSDNSFTIRLRGAGELSEHIQYVSKGEDVTITVPEASGFASDDVTIEKGGIDADLIVTIDCGDLAQLGAAYEKHKTELSSLPLLNIDHHASNKGFGTHQLVDSNYSSSCEIVLDLIEAIDSDSPLLTPEIATALLAGIVTDTGSFMNTSTTDMSLRHASVLMGYGADHSLVIQNLYKTNPFGRLQLWGDIFSGITTIEESRILYSVVTGDMYYKHKVPYGEHGGVVDKFMTSVPDYDVVLLFSELPDREHLEISARSPNSTINLYPFMERLGGGGHKVAAGAKISCSDFSECRRRILQDLILYIEKPESRITEEAQRIPEVEAGTAVAREVTHAPEQPPETIVVPEAPQEEIAPLNEEVGQQEAAPHRDGICIKEEEDNEPVTAPLRNQLRMMKALLHLFRKVQPLLKSVALNLILEYGKQKSALDLCVLSAMNLPRKMR